MAYSKKTDLEILANSNIGTQPEIHKAEFEAQNRRAIEAFLAQGGAIETLEPQHIPRPNTAR